MGYLNVSWGQECILIQMSHSYIITLDPKGGDLYMKRTKSGENQMEVLSEVLTCKLISTVV